MNKKQVRGKVLGQLESQMMEIIWRQKDAASVKSISEILNKKRPIAYTTVMTVMARLVNNSGFYLYKGLQIIC